MRSGRATGPLPCAAAMAYRLLLALTTDVSGTLLTTAPLPPSPAAAAASTGGGAPSPLRLLLPPPAPTARPPPAAAAVLLLRQRAPLPELQLQVLPVIGLRAWNRASACSHCPPRPSADMRRLNATVLGVMPRVWNSRKWSSAPCQCPIRSQAAGAAAREGKPGTFSEHCHDCVATADFRTLHRQRTTTAGSTKCNTLLCAPQC